MALTFLRHLVKGASCNFKVQIKMSAIKDYGITVLELRVIAGEITL